jgi:hypothetical protein
MNLREIRDRVYNFLQAEEDRGLWGSAEIDGYIHDAHMKVFGYVAEAMEDFCVTTTTISEVASQADYDLPTDLVRLVWARRVVGSGGTLARPWPLRRISRSAAEIYRSTPTGTTSASVGSISDAFYLTGQRQITLLSTPSAAVTNSIQIRYVFRPAQMTQDDHVPFQQTAGSGGAGFDNLEEYHDLLWLDAAQLALMKEESDAMAAGLSRRYSMRLEELQNHIDRVNIHEPRFVAPASNDEDGYSEDTDW